MQDFAAVTSRPTCFLDLARAATVETEKMRQLSRELAAWGGSQSWPLAHE